MTTPNIQEVQKRLEAARKNLLDLSLRNKLINFRMSKSRGVEVIGEYPDEVYRILVTEGKTMTFVGKPDKRQPDEPKNVLFEPTDEKTDDQPQGEANNFKGETPAVDLLDTKLNTDESETALQCRLLKTYRDAQTSLEEQGINVLYLALGMLEWYESDSSQESRRAPLILIPVLIERYRRADFKIRYEDTEVGENLSLAAKLQQDYGIPLPKLPDGEALNIRDYFIQVSKAIEQQKRWRVDDKAIVLGFFSYSKYLMYKDLEGTLWVEKEKPWLSNHIGALLDCGFDEKESVLTEDLNIDKHRPIEHIHEVCDVDSTQALAILESKSGASMIIQGPPGTGKSQTITNLIAEALGGGKKVLFVAEKRAALDVVLRYMKKVGLHEACLELHSNKTDKKKFYTGLKETQQLGRPNIPQQQTELKRLGEIRDYLNGYCEAVNQHIEERVITPLTAIGRLLDIGKGPESLIKIDFNIMQGWTQQDFEKRLELIQKIQTKVREDGIPTSNPFWGSALRLLLPDDKFFLNERLKLTCDAVETIRKVAEALCNKLKITRALTLPELQNAIKIAQRIASAPPNDNINYQSGLWIENETFLRNIIEAGKRLKEIHKEHDGHVKPQAWFIDIGRDRDIFKQYGKKWWRFLNSNYNNTFRKLREICEPKPPKTYSERLSLIEAIIEAQEHKKTLGHGHKLAKELYDKQWKGEQSDWFTLGNITYWALETYRLINNGELPPEILSCLREQHDNKELIEAEQQASLQCDECEAHIVKIMELLQTEGDLVKLSTIPFVEQTAKLEYLIDNLPELQNLVSFNRLYDEVCEQGLKPLGDIAASWENAGDNLADSFKRSWYSGIMREVIQKRPVLARFDRTSHEATINAFRGLDQLLLEYNRKKAALRHWEGTPKYTAGGSLGVLLNEFAKIRRHKTIRKIMAEAGAAIQDIKPIFMMSPLSVAMYLPPDGPKFDMVIFDEASQIKPEDAFGSIIRGNQIIVVGDTQQLPPTSFFDKITQVEDDYDEETEAETNVTRDIESILTLMESKTSRKRELLWHYRSKHDSLIATSNHLFYRNRLKVFPSPERQRKDTGLVFHHLPGTIYDRGGSRKNIEEAKIVVQAVLKHIQESPHLSLGVAAFSNAQSEAIQNELELQRRNPDAEQALTGFNRTHPHEPLFIKNLETVQGDEREVILISVGYGREATGRILMQFGPVNKDGGERRLNVLISRSRTRCEVFSNLKAEDIRLDKDSKPGVHALRTFLHFAETGELDLPTPSGKDPQSDFECAVIKAIQAQGYKIEPQVGTAGFFIDIGVCDPGNPGRFILGIECDGAQYHSHRSARDRDRLREQVLRNRGWRIHRIWSTDWWLNPERELRRTIEAIEKAIQCNGQEPHQDRATNPTSEIKREPIVNQNSMNYRCEYKIAQLKLELGRKELRDIPPKQMSEWVWQVVVAESPVHLEEVIRRIREACGLERAGDPIRSAIWRGALVAAREGKIKLEEDEYLWKSPIHAPTIRNRASFPNHVKKLDYVHPEEIKAALMQVVGKSYGIAREEARVDALRLLGFERTTDVMHDRIDMLITDLINNNVIQDKGGKLRVSNG